MLLVRTVQAAIAASVDDTNRFRTGVTYPPLVPGGNQNTNTFLVPSKSFFTPNYNIDLMFLRFDTAVIPDDATVTAATLRFMAGGAVNVDTRSINFEWYNWAPALSDSDWVETPGTTAGVMTLASLTGGTVSRDLVLSSPAANITKTGFTGIRFGIDGSTPTGQNDVFISAWDHATNPEPLLIVDYELTTFTMEPVFPKPILRTPVAVRW